MKRIFSVFAAVLMVAAMSAQDKIVLRLMGDSTMADKDLSYENPERGWGQRLKSHVDGGVVVANYAQNTSRDSEPEASEQFSTTTLLQFAKPYPLPSD